MTDNEATARGIITTTLIVFTYIYNSIGILFIVLVMSMVVDYITGMFAGYLSGELSSKRGIIGILKKLSYMGLILIAFLFDLTIIQTTKQAGINISLQSIFGVLVTAWLFGNESISIIENLVLIGVPVPLFFSKGLKVFKDLIEKLNDKDIGEQKKTNKNIKKTVTKIK